jgi:cytochrome c oxidase cbb3-type subunit 3
MPTKIEKDSVTGTQTTGHEWDGLRELNTPLPKWWLYVWIATIIWAAVWFVLYPSIPLFHSYWHGALGYSSRGTVDREVHAVAQQRAGVMDKVASLSFSQIRANPELMAAVQTAGRITFANNCQPCHAAGGAGQVGYPALAAGAWIWGGSEEQIEQTITYGIRSGHPRARDSQMPVFGGTDGVLKPAEIEQVADFVMTLFGRPRADATVADVASGRELYATNCAACHGDTGQGNRDFGAPVLTSHVHLYGGTYASVVAQITQPHMGVMPNWNTRLDAATIKSVAMYVHDLGGGE